MQLSQPNADARVRESGRGRSAASPARFPAALPADPSSGLLVTRLRGCSDQKTISMRASEPAKQPPGLRTASSTALRRRRWPCAPRGGEGVRLEGWDGADAGLGAGQLRPWLALAGPGWPWLALAGAGCPWLAPALAGRSAGGLRCSAPQAAPRSARDGGGVESGTALERFPERLCT